jgi:hypothetical protein
MNTDDFEQRLQRQPLRPVPPEWRDEILAAARAGAAPSSLAPRPSPLLSLLRDWLWPHPVAWGALAAGWALVVVLNSAAGGPVLTAMMPLPHSAAAWAARAGAWDEPFTVTPSEPLAPPPRRVPNTPARPPGTTWIPDYEEDIA